MKDPAGSNGIEDRRDFPKNEYNFILQKKGNHLLLNIKI